MNIVIELKDELNRQLVPQSIRPQAQTTLQEGLNSSGLSSPPSSDKDDIPAAPPAKKVNKTPWFMQSSNVVARCQPPDLCRSYAF